MRRTHFYVAIVMLGVAHRSTHFSSLFLSAKFCAVDTRNITLAFNVPTLNFEVDSLYCGIKS